MKRTILLLLLLICTCAYASDYHQNSQSHRVVYTILDSTGTPVSGQTVRLAVERSSDSYFLDFNDNTFKASGWTTRLTTMDYDTAGQYYYKTVQIDGGNLVSGDYTCIVSNDNATYKDYQTETVAWDTLAKLIKINR